MHLTDDESGLEVHPYEAGWTAQPASGAGRAQGISSMFTIRGT
ncbi:hypothetical protein [Actinoplanes sp. NPDC049265]